MIFVPYGDADALAAAVDDTVAAVVLEPIQGENGVVVPPAGYLRAGPARSAMRTARCCGSTRCRPAWAGPAAGWCTSAEGVTADIVTVAKGLGNGFPIGACVALGRAATLLGPGSHGSTFGGNPVAAIAGLAVIAVIERDGLLARATDAGRAPRRRGHRPRPSAGHRRPRSRPAPRPSPWPSRSPPAVADAALDAGFIINAPRPDVLRLAPPLIITAAQLDTFVAALPGLLDGSRSDRMTPPAFSGRRRPDRRPSRPRCWTWPTR